MKSRNGKAGFRDPAVRLPVKKSLSGVPRKGIADSGPAAEQGFCMNFFGVFGGVFRRNGSIKAYLFSMAKRNGGAFFWLIYWYLSTLNSL